MTTPKRPRGQTAIAEPTGAAPALMTTRYALVGKESCKHEDWQHGWSGCAVAGCDCERRWTRSRRAGAKA
jgi:hypothetical protein